MLVLLGAGASFAPAGRGLQPCLPRGRPRQQAFCTSAGSSGKKTRTSLPALMVAADVLEENVPEEAFACTTEEHEMMKAIGGALASAYGEITRAGFSALGKNLRLERDDVFVDCGSGRGQTVAQAAREFGVARAYGIEFAASRHERAVADLERGMTPEDAAAIALFQGVRPAASPHRAADRNPNPNPNPNPNLDRNPGPEPNPKDCADATLWASGGVLSACTCAYVNNKLFDAALNGRLKACEP